MSEGEINLRNTGLYKCSLYFMSMKCEPTSLIPKIRRLTGRENPLADKQDKKRALWGLFRLLTAACSGMIDAT